MDKDKRLATIAVFGAIAAMADPGALCGSSDDCNDPPGARPVKPKRHIGRNNPCYCGSGKKFKHCCRINSNPA